MSDERLDPSVFDYVDNSLSVQAALEELEFNRFYKFRVLNENESCEWIVLNTSNGRELWRKHRNWNEFFGFYQSVRNAMYDAVSTTLGR